MSTRVHGIMKSMYKGSKIIQAEMRSENLQISVRLKKSTDWHGVINMHYCLIHCTNNDVRLKKWFLKSQIRIFVVE